MMESPWEAETVFLLLFIALCVSFSVNGWLVLNIWLGRRIRATRKKHNALAAKVDAALKEHSV